MLNNAFRKEPDAGKPHVRFLGGAHLAKGASTRPWYYKGVKNAAKKVEIDLVAKIRKHTDDPKFIKLGDRLEKLREQHEQGLLNSIEFLKMLLELAKEAAAEKEVILEEEVDKGKAALTELFNGVKNTNTPVIVKRGCGRFLGPELSNSKKASILHRTQQKSVCPRQNVPGKKV